MLIALILITAIWLYVYHEDKISTSTAEIQKLIRKRDVK